MDKIPIIDFSGCIRCELCIQVCPEQAIYKSRSSVCEKCIKYCISMEVPCNPFIYVFDYKTCNSCGKCVSQCPVKAISWFLPQNISENK